MIHSTIPAVSSVTSIGFTDPERCEGLSSEGLRWSRQVVVYHTDPATKDYQQTATQWLYGATREAILLPHELAAEQAAAKVNESTVVAGGCE